MSIFTNILQDLREKRLLPVIGLLIVALIAIPIVVSSSGSSAPTVSLATPPATATTPVPDVQVTPTPGHTKLTGHARNPFAQQHVTSAAASTSPAKAASSSSSSSSSAAKAATSTKSSSAASTSTTSTSSSTTPTTTTPTTTTPKTTTPKPKAPVGLTPSQVYDVSLSITNNHGGVSTVQPLTRMSVIPSPAEPFLVELGVLKGGHRALFAVQPGTHVSGSAQCIPGPVSCEVIAMAPGQLEDVLAKSPTGAYEAAVFSLTGISKKTYGSAAAATRARQKKDSVGSQLLKHSSLTALSLFSFSKTLGAVVEATNVKVSG